MPNIAEDQHSGGEEFDGSDDEVYDLFGSMKTTVCWDAKEKQLSVNLRQYAESTQRVCGLECWPHHSSTNGCNTLFAVT